MVCLYRVCGMNKVEQSSEEFVQVECKSYTQGEILALVKEVYVVHKISQQLRCSALICSIHWVTGNRKPLFSLHCFSLRCFLFSRSGTLTPGMSHEHVHNVITKICVTVVRQV